jgi:hypothetical protein
MRGGVEMIAARWNGVQSATHQLEPHLDRIRRTFIPTLPWTSFETPPAHYSSYNSFPLSMPTAPLDGHSNYAPPIFILHHLNRFIQNPSLQSARSPFLTRSATHPFTIETA